MRFLTKKIVNFTLILETHFHLVVCQMYIFRHFFCYLCRLSHLMANMSDPGFFYLQLLQHFNGLP